MYVLVIAVCSLDKNDEDNIRETTYSDLQSMKILVNNDSTSKRLVLTWGPRPEDLGLYPLDTGNRDCQLNREHTRKYCITGEKRLKVSVEEGLIIKIQHPLVQSKSDNVTRTSEKRSPVVLTLKDILFSSVTRFASVCIPLQVAE